MARPVMPTTRKIDTAESEKTAATWDSGRAPEADTRCLALPDVVQMTAPRATVLMIALIDSQMPCVPNIRLRPDIGLSLEKVGLMALPLSTTPPCAAEATVP